MLTKSAQTVTAPAVPGQVGRLLSTQCPPRLTAPAPVGERCFLVPVYSLELDRQSGGYTLLNYTTVCV